MLDDRARQAGLILTRRTGLSLASTLRHPPHPSLSPGSSFAFAPSLASSLRWPSPFFALWLRPSFDLALSPRLHCPPSQNNKRCSPPPSSLRSRSSSRAPPARAWVRPSPPPTSSTRARRRLPSSPRLTTSGAPFVSRLSSSLLSARAFDALPLVPQHSYPSSYSLQERDGWETVSASDLPYKYRNVTTDALAPSARSLGSRDESYPASAPHNRMLKRRVRESKRGNAVEDLVGNVEGAVDSLMKAVGKATKVIITWCASASSLALHLDHNIDDRGAACAGTRARTSRTRPAGLRATGRRPCVLV